MTNRIDAALLLALLMTACGGGGGGGTALPIVPVGTPAPTATTPTPPATPPPTTTVPTDAQRITAATATAQSTTNPCAPIQPFYWELGDSSQRKASGSVPAGSSPTYTASTVMSIASASKWLYGAYVVQRQNAVLSDSDVRFLTFRSGYTNFSSCLPGQTVDGCVAYQNNGQYTPATDGKFFYNGGHMEKHASLIGLGALDNAGLAAELQSQLGTDVGIRYSQPQPAGGVVSTADDYARFLRKILAGTLQMRGLLGSHPACTNPGTCGTAQALATPVPATESWHYSIGHWVEDDPAVGDGAFSSAGAFGFYPWIDAGKTWYGVLARVSGDDASGYASTQCGRLIRKAWVTGVAQ